MSHLGGGVGANEVVEDGSLWPWADAAHSMIGDFVEGVIDAFDTVLLRGGLLAETSGGFDVPSIAGFVNFTAPGIALCRMLGLPELLWDFFCGEVIGAVCDERGVRGIGMPI